ncbi:Reactive Intermediate Deaminase A [Picochlorum sp. SENEW3]|nr:Reactive Intermediate Deaminase A [Picochlorum sp. SENEW3]WPT17326.1 Reactive Intermediate Deaminase A [Picochlorum sp. SENEW3]
MIGAASAKPLQQICRIQSATKGSTALIARHRRRSAFSSIVMASSREVISTENAPGAVGPYSQAIKANGMVYVSGQVALVPGTKEFASPDVAGQTEQVMANLGAILSAAGTSFDKVVKTTILLADMSDFGTVNEIYGKYFPENPPARATFAVKGLPLGAKVEIDAVALE